MVGGTAGGIIFLALVATAALLLWSVFSRTVPDGHPPGIVGVWSGKDLDGDATLDLHSDGSYEEKFSGFSNLPDRTQEGSWTIRAGWLVLAPGVWVSSENSLGESYGVFPSVEIEVHRPFWSEVFMTAGDDLIFHQVSSATVE